MDWRIVCFVVGVTLCVVAAQTASAGAFELRRGGLALVFDDSSGALVQITCDGQTIARCGAGDPAVTFGVGDAADKAQWLEQMGFAPKLTGRATPSEGTLDLTITAGPYELVERYVLHADRPRIDRSLRLTNRGRETLKLRGMAFRTTGIRAVGDGGFYRFPGQWPPQSHAFAQMQVGRDAWGRGSIAPAIVQLSPRQSLLFASCTPDSPNIRISEGSQTLDVRQGVEAVGYLRPNQPQNIGFVSMEVVAHDYWSALPALWGWMDSAGVKVPADRARWMQGAVLYGFHPGGTIGSNFRDLGGFAAATEQLLPNLPGLGVTGVWILPIEKQSPYWPADYYQFMDGLGTAEQYKQLVARAHELGLHVLQDLVPHGGSPKAVHNVQHPEFMLRREDGSHLDYWLNDFAWPQWQQYIAGVAQHYVREYGVDGYRVDACYGSKEPNWNPQIPYARASQAMLEGGLGMLGGIRSAVRSLKPEGGAILAELESARHLAVSDAEYDFGLAFNVLHQWRRSDPAWFVAQLQEYLEEQKYAEPRGALRLRHIESHDTLRSRMWYGVGGMRALYALCAWIDGVPLIYQNMEIGHSGELARINRLRQEHPELARGEAFYRAVQCDAPGVFTCLRQLEGRSSVVAINFNAEPVSARLTWSGGGSAALNLKPFEYAILPQVERGAAESAPATQTPAPAAVALDTDAIGWEGATEWFIDTIEGRLRDRFAGPRGTGIATDGTGIYWRPQAGDVIWRADTLPLNPKLPRLGYRAGDGRWRIIQFTSADTSGLRLVDRLNGRPGLHLVGTRGLSAGSQDVEQLPAEPDVTALMQFGGVTLRCVGPEYIIANRHYRAHLLREGGLVRALYAGSGGGTSLVAGHDLYGDQSYFATGTSSTINASNDVECGIRVWSAPDGLHLAFEGQLRGFDRFALHRPPLWYRNEYVFGDGPAFTSKWAFRSEEAFQDQNAFLAFFLGRVSGERFRFVRDGKTISQGAIADKTGRVGQTHGQAAPQTILFTDSAGSRLWALTNLKTPAGRPGNVFLDGRAFFIALLDGPPAALEGGRWYEFQATWSIAPPLTP